MIGRMPLLIALPIALAAAEPATGPARRGSRPAPAQAEPGVFAGQTRLRPKPGEVFVFRSHSYLDGWFEFRDEAHALWPTFIYQRKGGPLRGSFTFDPVNPSMQFRLVCGTAVNIGADQTRRVLGEWTAAGHPQAILHITGCSPWQAPPSPGVDERGRPRRIEEGFYTTVRGTLTLQGRSATISSLARLQFATIVKDPEIGVAKHLTISGSFLIAPSELGLRHPGLADGILVRWQTQANLERHLEVIEKESGSGIPAAAFKGLSAPVPPMRPLAQRTLRLDTPTIPAIPAAEAAKQQAFRDLYYVSMDPAKRREALQHLVGGTDPTTRDLLAQVCLMERDDGVATEAAKLLAAFPDPTMETAEVLLTTMQNAPGGIVRAGLYASVAVDMPFKSPFARWFDRAADRFAWTPVAIDSRTKQPREAPEPTSRRYAEWVEAKRNRELWEKTLLPAFNRYAGTSLTLDAGTMAAVRDWVKANENRLIEADLARAVR